MTQMLEKTKANISNTEPLTTKNDVEVLTFGCRLNAFESDIIRNHAQSSDIGEAVVINTCAVTEESVRQARQAIRKTRKAKPNARLIVTGCAAQIDASQFNAMPEVDNIIGNEEKLNAQSYNLDRLLKNRESVSDIMVAAKAKAPNIAINSARTRAFAQIQTGCDHRCTFCTIPYGRGNSRSIPTADVIDQIKELVDRGHKEVVLTGVDLTSYGFDLDTPQSLGRLVSRILTDIPDLPRLRLSSIDSIEVDEQLFELIVSEPRIMPHLHLSLQSGDAMILKRMKRRHTPDQAVEFCQNMLAHRPDIVFGADFIAGFPTETDQMHDHTIRHIADCNLTWLHIFPYSPRSGTPAALMPQLDRTLIKERAAHLRKIAEQQWQSHANTKLGTKAYVLLETEKKGLAEDFTPVQLTTPGTPGTIRPVTINQLSDNKLIGVSTA